MLYFVKVRGIVSFVYAGYETRPCFELDATSPVWPISRSHPLRFQCCYTVYLPGYIVLLSADSRIFSRSVCTIASLKSAAAAATSLLSSSISSPKKSILPFALLVRDPEHTLLSCILPVDLRAAMRSEIQCRRFQCQILSKSAFF